MSKSSTCILGLLVFTGIIAKAHSQTVTFASAQQQIGLLELFTSEGCSSCPPAETWLSTLKEAPGLWRQFVPLAFHVDYWDNLGWRDQWGSEAFSDRQRAYAQAWRSGSIYTPAFVLNGKEWRAWTNSKTGPQPSGAIAGILKISSDDLKRWQVSFVPVSSINEQYQAHVALLANELLSDVKAGENRGRRLQHDFAVLALANGLIKLKGDTARGEVLLPESNRGRAEHLAIAAWVTRPGRVEPLQAVGGWAGERGPK